MGVQPFPKAAVVPVAAPNGHDGLVGCEGTIIVYASVRALKSASIFDRTDVVVQGANAVYPQGSGRVWLGSQAKENGLVDELGSLNGCIDSLAKDLKLKDFKLTYIRGKKSVMEIVSAMKPQFIKSDIIEKIEMIKSYSNKILYYDESLENF